MVAESITGLTGAPVACVTGRHPIRRATSDPSEDVLKPPAVELRAVVPDDLPILFEHQRDPESARMAAFPSRTREAYDAHMTKVLADPANVFLAIVADGELVGNVCAFARDGVDEVGYWIAREHWGKGFASAALQALLREVTKRPLHARVALHNLGSQRVLERCGFKEIGREIGDPAEDGTLIVDLIYRLEDAS
jgi:RimJ/RimL family protein N-acetyltransferase